MTTTTAHAAELDLAADQAITLRLDHADGAELAKTDPDVVTGIAVVKPGTFNGTFVVEESDLHAWADRFAQLAGVFRPPLREDHSWSVSSVLGRFEALRVEPRPDPTIGGADVPMLVGDVRLVGTTAEKADTRERILSGKYDERSSEFYPYRTNAGVEYPSVFMGAAFVDIPAVEGLGGITLRRDTLSHDTADNDDRSGTVPETDATTTDETAPVDVPAPAAAVPQEDPAPADTPAGDPDPEQADDPETAPIIGDDPTPDPAEDPTDPGNPAGEVPPATGDLRAALLAAVPGIDEVALRRAEREVERRVELRVEREQRLATLTGRGVVMLRLRPTVEALLAHDDAAVRDGVFAILDAARPPVAVGDVKAGTRTSVAPGGARDAEFIGLTMTREEVDEKYTAVYDDPATTPEQRATLRRELRKWQDAQAQ